jgi:hypothetical protein
VALVVGIVGVMAYFGMRASVFPNVPVSVDATETSSIDQLRGGKKKLVLALLIPGDPLSGQVVEMLKAEQAAHDAKAAFAGLLFADPGALDQFRASHELPYPLVSLTPQTNPVQYNEVVKAVGGASSRFYGGTVVVLDGKRKIVEQVNGNELETLSEALKGL